MPRGGLSNNAKCDAIEEAFKKNSQEVDLSDSYLGDTKCELIVREFRRHGTKTALNLRGNHIQTDGAVALSQLIRSCDRLLRLNLEWNNVGTLDHGIFELSNALMVNVSLKELDLRNNNIGPDGAIALSKALKRNQVLSTLDLRWNDIGSIGGQALLEAVQVNQTCASILLSGNNIPLHLCASIDKCLSNQKAGDGDQELLDYLSDKEHSDQLLSTSNQQLYEMQQKLQEHELTGQEFAIRLAKQSEISSRLQAELMETKDILEKTKQTRQEIDEKMTKEISFMSENRLKLEKECILLKDKVAMLQVENHHHEQEYSSALERARDEKREAQAEKKRLDLAFQSTNMELERCREQLHDERQRSNKGRIEAQEISNEKYRAMEQKFLAYRKETDERLARLEKEKSKAEEARKIAVNQAERCQSELLGEQMKRENAIAEVESHLQRELESRISISLKGLEARIKTVQEARDEVQGQMTRQTVELARLQEQQVEQLKSYEQEILKEKQTTGRVSEQLMKVEEEKVQLNGQVRKLTDQHELMAKRLSEWEEKYETNQKLHEEFVANLTASLSQDRVAWERTIEDKSRQVGTLEKKLQQQTKELRELSQSQEYRLNKLSDSIVSYLKDRFTQEKQLLVVKDPHECLGNE